MNEYVDDRQLREQLRAETTAAVDTAARPDFRADLRSRLADEWAGDATTAVPLADQTSTSAPDRRYLVLGIAAATLIAVGGGVLLTRGDDEPDTLVPATVPLTTVPASTVAPPTPTTARRPPRPPARSRRQRRRR